MARRKTHEPLDVWINGRLAGKLLKEPGGAISFTYHASWLDWSHRFPVSLSLPLQSAPWRGEPVVAVFDNLLPDNPDIRRKVAERFGAAGPDAYSLLEEIGRDCVGAMQFLPEGERPGALDNLQGTPLDAAQIEKDLANLGRAPLGIDPEQGFRISIAGAQEKMALLFHDGQWMRPIGTTPTTHILKPEIGTIPTAGGEIDLSASVDNEHYCLVLLEQFGLDVAKTEIRTFGRRRVLVVERFDRELRQDGRMLRLPQEDCCQALGVPSTRKYQSTVEGHRNGPGVIDIMKLLQGSDMPNEDREAFFRSQIIFWLIGATDGHAKNFSVFLQARRGIPADPVLRRSDCSAGLRQEADTPEGFPAGDVGREQRRVQATRNHRPPFRGDRKEVGSRTNDHRQGHQGSARTGRSGARQGPRAHAEGFSDRDPRQCHKGDRCPVERA